MKAIRIYLPAAWFCATVSDCFFRQAVHTCNFGCFLISKGQFMAALRIVYNFYNQVVAAAYFPYTITTNRWYIVVVWK